MSEDESKFRKLTSYGIIGAVVFASFVARLLSEKLATHVHSQLAGLGGPAAPNGAAPDMDSELASLLGDL